MEPTLFVNTNSFGSHILAGPVISPHIDDSTDSFGSPILAGPLISPHIDDSTDAFGTPAVATPLWPTLYVDTDNLIVPLVGPPGLTPSLYVDTDNFLLSTNIDFTLYHTKSDFASTFGEDHQIGTSGARIEVVFTGLQMSATAVIWYATLYDDSADFFGTAGVAAPVWPPTINDGDTIYAPRLARILSPTSFVNTNSFGNDHQIGLDGARIEVTFASWTLQQTGVNKFAPHYIDLPDTFHLNTQIDFTIYGGLYTDGDAFGTPAAHPRLRAPYLDDSVDSFGADHQIGFPGARIEVTFASWTLQETNRALRGNLYVDPDIFPTVTVNPDQVLPATLFEDLPDNFTVTVVGNNLNVNRFIDLPDTLYPPVAIDFTIYPTRYIDPDVIGGDLISYKMEPTLFVDGDSFGSSDVYGPLYPTAYVDPDTFGTSGNITLYLTPTGYVDGETFGSPTITLNLIAPHIDDSVDSFGPDHQIGFYGARIEVTFASWTLQETIFSLYPDYYADPDIFYAASLDGPKTAPHYIDLPDTFYTPIVAGPVIAPHIDDSIDTFGSVNVTQILHATVLTDGDTLYPPNVIRLITPDILVDPDTFYLSTNIDFTLYGTLYVDPDVFDGGTLEGYLSPTIYSDPDTFYNNHILAGPVIAPHIDDSTDSFGTHNLFTQIYGSLYVDPDQFGTAQIDQTIYASLYVDPDEFGNDLITIGLEPTLVDDSTDTFGSPQVNHILHASLYVDPDFGGGDRVDLEIFANRFVDGDVLYPPTDIDFTIFHTQYNDPDQFGNAQISTRLYATTYTDTDSFGTINVGQVLRPSLYIDPDFAGGDWIDLNINANIFTNQNTFGDARVFYRQYMEASIYVEEPDWFGAPVVAEFRGLFPPIIDDSTDTFGDHILAGPVIAPHYIDPDTFYSSHELGVGSRRNDLTTVYVQVGKGFVFRANTEIQRATVYERQEGTTLKVANGGTKTVKINRPQNSIRIKV